MDRIANCQDDTYIIDDETERFVCTKCNPGLTWEYSLTASKPWQCNWCDLVYPDCVSCRDNQCVACSNGKIPNFDGKGCVDTIADCTDIFRTLEDPGYGIDEEGYFCTKCAFGFYWDSDARLCLECDTLIPDCSECFNDEFTGEPLCTKCGRGPNRLS